MRCGLREKIMRSLREVDPGFSFTVLSVKGKALGFRKEVAPRQRF